MLQVSKPALVDADAAEIGRLYAHGNAKLVEAVNLHLECGRRLLAKKESLRASIGHGGWLAWLKANHETLGFDRTTAARLMNAAKANVAPAQHLSEALEISRQMWGHDKGGLYANCTGFFDWFSPPHIVEAAREVMGGIDLDPASCPKANEVVKAKKIYTIEDDGLQRPWSGRVFLNPPFKHSLIEPFSKKLIATFNSGEIEQAVFLCNSSTETKWWQALAANSVVCMPRQRLNFWGPKGEQTIQMGQSIFYLGWHCEEFSSVFKRFGRVLGDVVELLSYDEADVV